MAETLYNHYIFQCLLGVRCPSKETMEIQFAKKHKMLWDGMEFVIFLSLGLIFYQNDLGLAGIRGNSWTARPCERAAALRTRGHAGTLCERAGARPGTRALCERAGGIHFLAPIS